jgi:hypothetical protein
MNVRKVLAFSIVVGFAATVPTLDGSAATKKTVKKVAKKAATKPAATKAPVATAAPTTAPVAVVTSRSWSLVTLRALLASP